MPRLPIPSDTEAFPAETRAAVRHILQTRKSMPPPSSYLTYAGQAGALLSDLVDHLRYHTSLTGAETELAICTSARASNARRRRSSIWLVVGLIAGPPGFARVHRGPGSRSTSPCRARCRGFA